MSVISDVSNTVVATVGVGSNPKGVAYDSAEHKVFVANYGSNNVSVISDVSNTVVATVDVGSNPDSVAYDSRSSEIFVTNYNSDDVSVIPDARYNVTFAESGLPSGTSWWVAVNGWNLTATSTSNTFTELLNGTYAYTIGDVAGWHQTTLAYSGYVEVSGASLSEPTLAFIPMTYSVMYAESGLPPGTIWSVTVNGTTQTSANASLMFTEPNGSYLYAISDVPGWHQTNLPYSGQVTVDGALVATPTLTFTQVAYAVTFTETGLPNGTNWSVTLNGSSQSSTTSTVVFSEPNDTYSYAIETESGYTRNVTLGSVTVAGSSKTVFVSFTPTSAGGGGSSSWFSGLSTTDWTIVGAVVVIVVAAGVAIGMRGRRRGGSTVSPSQGLPQPPPKQT